MRVGWVIRFWLLNKTLFVWLDPLTRPVNNAINIFLTKSNIILYHVLSLNIYGYLKYS